MEIPRIIPEAPIVRITGKHPRVYVVRCPYCENQHFHAVRGGLGNRSRHCIDLRFMRKPSQVRFIMNCEKYGGCSTYDIVSSSSKQSLHD